MNETAMWLNDKTVGVITLDGPVPPMNLCFYLNGKEVVRFTMEGDQIDVVTPSDAPPTEAAAAFIKVLAMQLHGYGVVLAKR